MNKLTIKAMLNYENEERERENIYSCFYQDERG